MKSRLVEAKRCSSLEELTAHVKSVWANCVCTFLVVSNAQTCEMMLVPLLSIVVGVNVTLGSSQVMDLLMTLVLFRV